MILVFFATLLILSGGAWLVWEEYPTKPLSMLITFGVGGSTNVMGRALATVTEKQIRRSIVAINRPSVWKNISGCL